MKKRYNQKTHVEFIDQANNIHTSMYDYLSDYINAKTKIEIRHKKCGYVFFQTPNHHINFKRGCPKCGIAARALKATKTHKQFVKDANKIHNNEYNYISKYITDASKIQIQHKQCGYIFFQRATSHLQGNGCPECSSSKGELLIKHWLQKNNVYFLYQHKFEKCINPETGRKLKFDFYLPNHNTAIEFDGLQHYQPVRFVGMSNEQADAAYTLCKKLDKIKNIFCKQNNIELVRIGFVRNKIDSEKIDEVLLEVIN